jgi:hypothetical protein
VNSFDFAAIVASKSFCWWSWSSVRATMPPAAACVLSCLACLIYIEPERLRAWGEVAAWAKEHWVRGGNLAPR